MFNTIQFLETLGSNPVGEAEYPAVIGRLDVTAPERAALLSRDQAALGELLGGRRKMFFGVLAPHEEPLDDEELPFEETPEETPSGSVRLG